MAKKEGKTDYECETQQNLMRVAEYLATDVTRPTGIKDISAALGMTYNQANWTMHNMRLRGWAEQIGEGWRLSPRLVSIAKAVEAGIGEMVGRYLK